MESVSDNPTKIRTKYEHGVGIEVILGMTWIKTKRSAVCKRFSAAQRTARLLAFPPRLNPPKSPLTATATAFMDAGGTPAPEVLIVYSCPVREACTRCEPRNAPSKTS